MLIARAVYLIHSSHGSRRMTHLAHLVTAFASRCENGRWHSAVIHRRQMYETIGPYQASFARQVVK